MNSSQIKCLAVFSLFAVIGFGPVSPGCLIGMYVVALRPRWFRMLIANMYANTSAAGSQTYSASQTSQSRTRCFLSLLGLFIVDIAPVPVTPVVAFVIILSRPQWFYRMVARIYGGL
jgi:cobalamin synthase